jgi:hypothetical protein
MAFFAVPAASGRFANRPCMRAFGADSGPPPRRGIGFRIKSGDAWKSGFA